MIAKLMKEYGISQMELGKKANVNPVLIKELLDGKIPSGSKIEFELFDAINEIVKERKEAEMGWEHRMTSRWIKKIGNLEAVVFEHSGVALGIISDEKFGNVRWYGHGEIEFIKERAEHMLKHFSLFEMEGGNE